MAGEHLLTSPLLKPGYFTTDLVRRIRPLATEIRFASNEILVHQGETLSDLFLLADGNVKFVSSSRDGSQRVLAIAMPPSLLGMELVLDRGPAQYDLIAMTKIHILRISGGTVQRLMEQDPEFARCLGLSITHMVRLGLKSMIDSGIRSTQEQLRCLLHQLARQWDGNTLPVIINYPQQFFADLLGVSRYTITNELAALKDEGVIDIRRGSIHVWKPELLSCNKDVRYCISLADAQITRTG